VTLIWKASKFAVRGYNVYRGTKSGGPYTKVNRDLVQGLTYKDENVRGGTTYYYVTRSVDADGRESVNSSEITVVVP
jgi:fibronectin type 3 domain-containing protein